MSRRDGYAARVAHRASYVRPPVEVVPLGWRERAVPPGPWAAVLRGALEDARTVLDVGAGDRAFADILRRLGLDAAYASVDVEGDHDFADFLAVDDPFDAVLMLDLVEHLVLDEGLAFLDHAAALAPVLVLSTPNPAHPTAFAASDVTHVTAWPGHDLRGALLQAGFIDVETHRLQHTDGRPLRAGLQRLTARALGVDPADELLVVARR